MSLSTLTKLRAGRPWESPERLFRFVGAFAEECAVAGHGEFAAAMRRANEAYRPDESENDWIAALEAALSRAPRVFAPEELAQSYEVLKGFVAAW